MTERGGSVEDDAARDKAVQRGKTWRSMDGASLKWRRFRREAACGGVRWSATTAAATFPKIDCDL